MMPLKSVNRFIYILVIISLAIALGGAISAIYNYQQQQESFKAFYDLKLKVQEKLLIDSVLSAYEQKHRYRLDSISNSYKYRIDSLSSLMDQLKLKTHVIQTNLVPADSLLPVY